MENIQGKVGCMIGNSNLDIKMVLKDIRRKGKNKNSAAISRHKKISRIQQLREVKQQKEKELNVKNWYSSRNLVRCKYMSFSVIYSGIKWQNL